MEKKKALYIKPQLKLIPLGSQEYDQHIHALHVEQKKQEENNQNALSAAQPWKDSPKKQSDG